MKRRVALTFAIGVAALLSFSGSSVAGQSSIRSCRNIAGTTIRAHAIGCNTARRVHRAGGPVVLGGTVYGAPTGKGWGTARPHFIYNGGDASGLISDVHWSSWGGAVARGRGRHPIFRPRGGYFRHPVVALLKATDLGECEGRRAYLRLLIREPRRPGGPLGPWRSWAGPQTLCEPYGSSFG